jgi:alanine dehydrogenase
MNVGVPTEIKIDERRVALTPAGAAGFVAHGHRVLVQAAAGAGSGFADSDYREAGASVLSRAQDIWRRADLVLKVKEPQPREYALMRPGLALFTYLHLAADRRLTRELMRRRVTALGYETIQLEDLSLPLLAPMSEVAGRLSIQAGSWCLQARSGGRGVLLSGASGVRPGKVVVLGGGIAGANAARVAAGIGAEVTIMDINPSRLRYLGDMLGGRVTTVMSNRATLDEEVTNADLVIGSVLVPGARAPRLISASMVSRMRPGAAIVDLSIDQGGVSETSRPTTHRNSTYIRDRVVHYCVTNMPAIVPHTSTYALTNATLTYALEIADHGVLDAGARNPAIRHGLNVFDGRIAHPAVALTMRAKAHSPWE